MAKKTEVFNICKKQTVTDVCGIFDKNENGEYIICADGQEYPFADYADYLLGSRIEFHDIEEES